jgi:hypothetical protein
MSAPKDPAKHKEWRDKISRSRIGKYSKEKHPRWGKPITEKTRLAVIAANKRRTGSKKPCGLSEEQKQKLSELGRLLVGDKNPNWKGGLSFEPYCVKFNKEFKERVRSFFGRKCVVCGMGEADLGYSVFVHHVNYDKGACCNNNIPLFVTLCNTCHGRTNKNREQWEETFTALIREEYNGKCYYSKEEYCASLQ